MTEDSLNVLSEAQLLNNSAPLEPSVLAVAHAKRDVVLTRLLLGAAITGFLIVGFVLLRSTGQDDCYITYWPAHALAKYGRIINYNGDAVEQSSSLLWVLLLALASAVTRLPIPLLGPLMSIVCGVLSVCVISLLAARVNRNTLVFSVFFTCTSTYLMYWSFSGMEMSLAAICVTWLTMVFSAYIVGLRIHKIAIVAATLGCVLIRPEMGAVLCTMLVGLGGVLWIRRRLGLIQSSEFSALVTRVGHIALIVVGVVIGVVSFRMVLFHSPVPEPALVKGVGHHHILQGLKYLYDSCSSIFVLPAVCLVLVGTVSTLKDVFVARRLSITRLICALVIAAYLCFIVWVGGDWMRAGRFIVPVIPVAMFMAAYAMDRFVPARLLKPVGVAVVVVQLFGLVWFAKFATKATSPSNGSSNAELTWFDRTDRLFLRDAPVADAVDRVVTRMVATGHPVSHIISAQMGFVMYQVASHQFGHVDITDRCGLEDRRLATCSLANKQERLTSGLSVGYAWYLSHRQALESACGIPVPDIIYDIEDDHNIKNHRNSRTIQKYDYVIVYQRLCDVAPQRNWLAGAHIRLQEFIAVRRDLLGPLGLRAMVGDENGDGTL